IDLELEQVLRRAEREQNLDSNVRESKTAAAFEELLQAKREDILRTATRYGASNVRVFGSVARGEADVESDIDLLVDVEPGRTLFDLSELLLDLQELLGRNVDIVTEKGLPNRIRQRVLKEAIPL
ncbi:MAG TPA: nucleotidyltransferase domain-containing protein, partial [Ktedonobacteraceae bacterium]|nr:nucleotidyltransferase domain-containing protein [Ktedonobacteraceae bacterium]